MNNVFLSAIKSRGVLFWQCAVVFLVSLNLMQRIILSLIGQESAEIIWQFIVYILALLLLQIALCRWIGGRRQHQRADKQSGAVLAEEKTSFVARWRVGLLIFPAVLTFNILGLFLSYTVFAAFGDGWRLAALAILFVALAAFFIRAGRGVLLALTLLCLFANAEIGFQLWQKTSIDAHVSVDNWRDLFAKKFQKTPFTKKPNVYLISWDALAPEAIAKEYLQIPEGTLAYPQYLAKNGFRVFKNVFTDRTTTPSPGRKLTPFLSEGSRVFHNSLLFLDPILWETQPGTMNYFYKNYNYPGQFYYFSGRRPSPLYEIFKENGYKILVSYESDYFGKSGPYVDRYLIPKGHEGQCNFSLPWFHFQSLGFCQFRRYVFGLWQAHSPAAHVAQLLPLLSRHAASGQPWLNFVYINSPGHTNLNYRGLPAHKEHFRRALLQKSKGTVSYMRQIINLIRRDDADALVLFFGDHGYGLRRALLDKRSVEDEEEKRFHILDAHAVMGAIYPADACASQMKFSTKYITTAMLVRAVIVCLADGKDPVNWEVDYGLPYADARFEDYLYE